MLVVLAVMASLAAAKDVAARAHHRPGNPFGRRIFGIAAGGAIQSEHFRTMARDLNTDRAAGANWLRVDINWAQIQRDGPRKYRWWWIDRVVREARRRGMSVLGTIIYTPSWDRPPSTAPTNAPDPASYGAFAYAAARHYSRLGVHAYELWNEENTTGFWTPAPNPAAYAALLRAAYPAIKLADPRATVVTGGTSPAPTGPNMFSPIDFLSDIYAAGGGGYFDAVGAHPYCDPAQPGDRDRWSAWYQMYGTRPSMRSVMIAHGDAAKKIWATEFGAPTGGPARSMFISQSAQAASVLKGYRLWSRYAWAGPLFIFQGRDQGTEPSTINNFYGLTNHDFTPKPAFAAYRRAAALY